MAFNMKRPIIKGTVLHKASIAKAKKKSIVTPATVGADPTLVRAGELLGESNIGDPIDFSIDHPDFDSTKAKKTTKGKKSASSVDDAEKWWRERGKDLTKERLDKYNDMMLKQQEALDFRLDIEEEDDPEPEYSAVMASIVKEKERLENEKLKQQQQLEDQKETNDDAELEEILDESELILGSESPIQQRNDRIWGYAKKGGLIHKNMRKSGYVPQEER